MPLPSPLEGALPQPSAGMTLWPGEARRSGRRAPPKKPRGRTGVLLFVSAAERYAEVVADEGIAARVDERAWRDIITELVESIQGGRAADGIAAAVQRIGQILAEHVAPQVGNPDELSNKVILI